MTAEVLKTMSRPSTLIEWSDELAVGIQEIDDQHRLLVSILNRLHTAMYEHQGKEVAENILGELIDYTKIHFAVEESLMRILGYPEADEHKQHHEVLINEVKALQEKLHNGNRSISFELLHFLRMWLTKHIMNEDQLYAPFFLSKGAVATTDHKKSIVGRLWHSVFK
ncbi:bacteriohemerythrin [Gynuella sp.]|uniref:bacteriohemerythrin n=1 Tax=Gynuella sp. TaxID=2969146 RepID=UPI003D143A93